MAYFDKLPILRYDSLGDGVKKLVPDIFVRVKARDKVKNNVSLLDKYDVDEGDSPETVAYKVYGSTEYFWVVCMMNDVVNRFHDWPLSYTQFEEFIKDKYENPEAIHHYEKPQTSGKQKGEEPGDFSHMIEVNGTDPNAQSVSNREHEQRIQDKKRQIKILNPVYLPVFVEEFNKLVTR